MAGCPQPPHWVDESQGGGRLEPHDRCRSDPEARPGEPVGLRNKGEGKVRDIFFPARDLASASSSSLRRLQRGGR